MVDNYIVDQSRIHSSHRYHPQLLVLLVCLTLLFFAVRRTTNKMQEPAVDWESIIPIFSPLYESLRVPKGLESLLPLKRFLGENADVAIKTVNTFAKNNGFKVP